VYDSSGKICGVVLIVLSTIAEVSGAQIASEDASLAKETQARGYWVDSETGLTWVAHDNNKNSSWDNSVRYCNSLRLAGFADWRLATIDELKSLIDEEAYQAKTAEGRTYFRPNTDLRVRGRLALTHETEWSSRQVTDANGKPRGRAWYFDFAYRRWWNDSSSSKKIHAHALCVRGATVERPSPEGTQERGYWVDRSTNLMWAARDDGRDTLWRGAMKYCTSLRLAGFPDWRLATIDELESLIDKEAYRPKTVDGVTTFRLNTNLEVSGGLVLTGQTYWSSSTVADDRGKPSGFAWYFDFVNVRRSKDDATIFGIHGHALCVRGANAESDPPSNGAQE